MTFSAASQSMMGENLSATHQTPHRVLRLKNDTRFLSVARNDHLATKFVFYCGWPVARPNSACHAEHLHCSFENNNEILQRTFHSKCLTWNLTKDQSMQPRSWLYQHILPVVPSFIIVHLFVKPDNVWCHGLLRFSSKSLLIVHL